MSRPLGTVLCALTLGSRTSVVFRELLQNSDDADAKSAEIHFDTEGYVQRTKDGVAGEESGGNALAALPDLKKVIVSACLYTAVLM